LDTDQDGRGDACDPPQTLDDDNNGIPDDVVTFNTTISCKKVPLPKLIVLGAFVHDLNGDHDTFADAGEIARMTVVVQNNSDIPVSGVNLVLGSVDPNIGCITKSNIVVGSIAAHATVDTGPANSQCTGSGAPASCCTGSGTGTCTGTGIDNPLGAGE